VLDADSAPPTSTSAANVDEAFEINPPEESTRNSVSSVLSTKRKKSPANTEVLDAIIIVYDVASVEDERTVSSELFSIPV
jgi:hypothetical protein